MVGAEEGTLVVGSSDWLHVEVTSAAGGPAGPCGGSRGTRGIQGSEPKEEKLHG